MLEIFARRFGKVHVIQTDSDLEFEKDFTQVVGQYCAEHVVACPYKKNDQVFIEYFITPVWG